MVGSKTLLALVFVPALLTEAEPVGAQTAPSIVGKWMNPRNSVKVETGNCAGKLCGWIVWASPAAAQDARDAGVQQLVGTKLLEDYQPSSRSRWTGHVFVPDMGRTFYSTISELDPNSLKISGCILGGMICKSQVWHRV